jgi:hypothetical protein
MYLNAFLLSAVLILGIYLLTVVSPKEKDKVYPPKKL